MARDLTYARVANLCAHAHKVFNFAYVQARTDLAATIYALLLVNNRRRGFALTPSYHHVLH